MQMMKWRESVMAGVMMALVGAPNAARHGLRSRK